MKKNDLIKIFVLLGLVIISYIPTFAWMIDRWSVKDTYYSHGFLVPFISLFLVWLKKDELSKLKIKPANIGWVFFGIGILVHAISALLRVYFTSGFSLIPVIVGLVLLFLGKSFLRKLWFPILFLCFMIPLPLVAIASISFKLKILASQISTSILNGLGVAATRDGSIIKTMHSYIIVEDPCSGIRSLIALIALGALMAYFSNISRTKKVLLFASSVPIAISSNVIRIVALSLVSEMYGAQWATGFFHTAMGFLVFVFSFASLLIISKLLE